MSGEIDVLCPKCGKRAVTVTKFVDSYYDPIFRHKCGYQGKLSWSKKPKELTPLPDKVTTTKSARAAFVKKLATARKKVKTVTVSSKA